MNKIKVEPIKTETEFINYIENNELRFAGMYFAGERKLRVFWITAISDTPVKEIITRSLEKIDYGYIIYTGKINDKFCVAVEIKC